MRQDVLDREIAYWHKHGLPATQRETLIDLLTEDRRRSRAAMDRARQYLLRLLDDPAFPDAHRHGTAVALRGLTVALDDPLED